MFSENVGVDGVVVFQGDLHFSTANTGSAEGPKDFDFVFAMQTPFTYDPTKGNLIFDVATEGTNLVIAQTVDFVSSPSPAVEEVVGTGGQLAAFRYGGPVVQFTVVPNLTGDYNADGTVDAADYVVWRKGLGTSYSQSDYDVWRSNFGKTAGNGAALPSAQPLSAAVPEPPSLIAAGLLLAAAFTGAVARRPVVRPHRYNHP
jgi:hypothetical protein